MTSSRDLRGIVLAGTHHWGGPGLERLLPRPLLPVAGSPLICYALRWLRDAGVRRATICANSDSGPLRRFLGGGDEVGMELTYYDDLSPRGPAGCVGDVGAAWPAGDFVVLECGLPPTVDLRAMLATHRAREAVISVGVARRCAPHAIPNQWLAPAGLYVFSRRALRAIAKTGYQDIKEVLIPKLHDAGEPVATFEVLDTSPRITCVESYLAANVWMLERIIGGAVVLDGYRRRAQACVHESARIADGARLLGAVLVGPETQIARAATIVGPAILGSRCRVAAGAVLCRSVVWDDCILDRGAVVEQRVLESGARVSGADPREDAIGGAAAEALLQPGTPAEPTAIEQRDAAARNAPSPPRASRETAAEREEESCPV